MLRMLKVDFNPKNFYSSEVFNLLSVSKVYHKKNVTVIFELRDTTTTVCVGKYY